MSQKTKCGIYGISTTKWRDRLSEMAAWTYLQMLRANATTTLVLREFATRCMGSLRDWFDTLGEYIQLQFVQLPNVSSALSVIHEQFIRESAAVFEAARRDYLNMKCCSRNSKNLDFHYKRMSILFYKLNGFPMNISFQSGYQIAIRHTKAAHESQSHH